MKKIITLAMVILLVCACSRNSARLSVENYMKKYKTLDSSVLVDLEEEIKNENLNEEQEEKYRDILKKQYKDLSFEILEEEYDDDVSYVTVKIEVYDLYKAQSDAFTYLENYPQEFYNDDNKYDVNKFMIYKLNRMMDTTDRIDYKIIFTVTKEDNKYVIMQPTNNDLKKIHGVYNYELE